MVTQPKLVQPHVRARPKIYKAKKRELPLELLKLAVLRESGKKLNVQRKTERELRVTGLSERAKVP